MNKIDLIDLLINLALSFDNGTADFYEGIIVAIQGVCEWEAHNGE